MRGHLQTTKAEEFQPTKWEGTGTPGILAGYRMSPGYRWNGAYLVWSLDELLAVDLSAGAKSFTQNARHPHVTEVCRLPANGEIRSHMKAEFDRLNYTLEGRRELRGIHPHIKDLFAPPPALPDAGEDADGEMEPLPDLNLKSRSLRWR